jgi:hydroxymethylglutaryl-CoA reductase
MLQDKENFLKHDYIPLLQKLTSGQKGNWGKMDGQQMVEHMRDVFKVANGKIVLPLLDADPEKLARGRAFIMSDGSFPQNAKVAVMPEEPRPYKYSDLPEAIHKMEIEMQDVFTAYASDKNKTLNHPVFGELNYEQQINYLDKHVRHHLRQFGLVD